jgi:UrcA family protein
MNPTIGDANMMTSTVKTLTRTALVVLLVGSGTAFADSAQPKTLDPAPVTVRYDDLNLASPEGARVLYRRISAAARKACGPNYAMWYPSVRIGWQECYKATVDWAVRQVNAPTLTALHAREINVAAR